MKDKNTVIILLLFAERYLSTQLFLILQMNNLKDEFLEKYSRQIIIDEVGLEGQKKSQASISIVGCGGLGTLKLSIFL